MIGSGLLPRPRILLHDRHESIDELPGLAARRRHFPGLSRRCEALCLAVAEKPRRSDRTGAFLPAFVVRAAKGARTPRLRAGRKCCGEPTPLSVSVPFENHQPASIDRLMGLVAGDIERVNAA